MSLFHRNMKQDAAGAGEPGSEGKDAPQETPLADESAAQLADLTRERDDYLARWQRAQADFQNLRRRTQSDIDAAVRRSQQSLLEGVLLSIDQLELALAAPRSDEAAAQLARGVEMTRAELLRTLASAGVQPMEALAAGSRFDPTLHQAVASLASTEREPGTIIEVVRRGYAWGEVVLRPAQVIVAVAAPKTSSPDSERAD
jgi:molecular chaperone GrpE